MPDFWKVIIADDPQRLKDNARNSKEGTTKPRKKKRNAFETLGDELISLEGNTKKYMEKNRTIDVSCELAIQT